MTDAATSAVKKTVTTDNVNYAIDKTKEQMTWDNAKKGYDWSVQNGKQAI